MGTGSRQSAGALDGAPVTWGLYDRPGRLYQAGAGAPDNREMAACATLATGSSLSLAACSTATRPRGAESVGSEAPENSTTVGAPPAAARCSGPVSLPMASAAFAPM